MTQAQRLSRAASGGRADPAVTGVHVDVAAAHDGDYVPAGEAVTVIEDRRDADLVARNASIVYRRLTMDTWQSGPLDRVTAAEYASWFRALADPTRVQIVSLLARHGRPMTVGEITAALDVGQSTVSAHLKILAGVRFVLAEQRGTARLYRVNDRCVASFPSAADIVIGRPVPAAPAC